MFAITAVSALLAACVLAGCGSGGSSASNAPAKTGSSADAKVAAAALARVVKDRTPPAHFIAPGPAFNARPARGKHVTFIAANLSTPYVKMIADATKQGLEAAGVHCTIVDGKIDISQTTRLIEQAISQRVDAIIVMSVSSAELAQPLRDANKAGVKVIEAFESDPGPMPAAAKAVGVDAEATFCSACAGRMMVDWVVADSKGTAQAATINVSGIGVAKPQVDAMTAAFKQCPGCENKLADVQLPMNWATQLPTLTRSTITANPKLRYLLPIYDDMSTFMVPAVQQAGAANRVKIVTFNGNPAFIKLIKAKQVVAADVVVPNDWSGWAFTDQTLRVLVGQPPLTDMKIPFLLVDSTNVGKLDLSALPDTWFNVDYRAGYKKLWLGV